MWMKRIITFIAVLALLVTPLFAAKAAPAVTTDVTMETQPAGSDGISTVTKEYSQAQYPGVLVPGSLIGTSVFISDLPLLANTGDFEYVQGNTFAAGVLKTDMGVFGISFSPVVNNALNDINLIAMPNNCLGVEYATKFGSMPFGASLQYGSNDTGFTNGDVATNNINPDIQSTAAQYLALRAGIVLNNIDLSLGISCGMYNDFNEDLATPSGLWNDTTTDAQSKMLIDLAARTSLGNGFKAVLDLSWLSGSTVYDYESDGLFLGAKYTETYTNSKLTLKGWLSNDIKPLEWLVVRVAPGVEIGGNTSGRYVYQDKIVSGFTTYSVAPFLSDAYLQIPFHVAVEGKLNDTWKINAGVAVTLLDLAGNDVKHNAAAGGTAEMWQEFQSGGSLNIDPGIDYAIGASGKIGDLAIDFWLNPIIFINGPHFITGANNGTLNSGVAVHFDWK